MAMVALLNMPIMISAIICVTISYLVISYMAMVVPTNTARMVLAILGETSDYFRYWLLTLTA